MKGFYLSENTSQSMTGISPIYFRLFEERCINILDRMYEEEPMHAVDVMDDEAVIWGVQSSPLLIAYENFMYDIVAHTCSQKHLNKQWYNNLAPDLKPFCKVKIRFLHLEGLLKNIRIRLQVIKLS